MQFGQVPNPEDIDFTLPADHTGTLEMLHKHPKTDKMQVFIGCAKWNRQELKGFYPRGTKDELAYYSTQFNSIELNATFYNIYGREQTKKWAAKTPPGFRFFPKVPRLVSHIKRLSGAGAIVEEYCDGIRGFGDKLGVVFLQMPDNFQPKDMGRLEDFVEAFPKDIPLAVELRNTQWFADEEVAGELYRIFEANNTINIITDTAGRRDLLHMRLTSPNAFVRYVGANHSSDYNRLDDWLERIRQWADLGLQNLNFFVHQNLERESPHLSAYLIEKLNKDLNCDLAVPRAMPDQGTLNL